MALSLATVLAVAAELGWPQVLYRSPVLNERYHLPAGCASWQRWAAEPPLACDLPRVLEILAALACDGLGRKDEPDRPGSAFALRRQRSGGRLPNVGHRHG